jgi:hypothetical protein
MRVIVEYLVERTTIAGETEKLEENLPQRHFNLKKGRVLHVVSNTKITVKEK